MFKKILFTSLAVFFIKYTIAQSSVIDSLMRAVSIAKNDTIQIILFGQIADAYNESNPDSACYYAGKVIQKAEKLNLALEKAVALGEMGYAFINLGNYPLALQALLTAEEIAEDPGHEKNVLPARFASQDIFIDRSAMPHFQRINILSLVHEFEGILYINVRNYKKALYHLQEARQLAEQTGNLRLQIIINNPLSHVYHLLNKPDSATIAGELAYQQSVKAGYKKYLGSILLNLAHIYAARGDRSLAKEYFKKAIAASQDQKYYRGTVAGDLYLADIFIKEHRKDSAFRYVSEAQDLANYLNAPDLVLRSATSLSNYYRAENNNDSLAKYLTLIIKIKDSLFSSKQTRDFQNIDFNEQERQRQIAEANAAYRNKIRIYALLAGFSTLLFVAVILWRNDRHKKAVNKRLSIQKRELESALKTLNETQAQLIQSEKMASLGELTAGIAHEIQNPLNFVNNFSEVNKELLEDLQEQAKSGDNNEVISIAGDISANEERIMHHGKRAGEIVKGMLQHSRVSTGQKELTDINKLTDEYVRLSYHGFCTKDKSFNTEIPIAIGTDFDETLGKINIVPQDIGRVLLNLYNNAFYAVAEKKKLHPDGYEPMVSVSTKRTDDKILVSVKDNGNGIPNSIKEKIFQPFFTTKPTGQGTGLGLSLSYDIIKAHGGQLKLESKEGEGSEFIIQLPVA